MFCVALHIGDVLPSQSLSKLLRKLNLTQQYQTHISRPTNTTTLNTTFCFRNVLKRHLFTRHQCVQLVMHCINSLTYLQCPVSGVKVTEAFLQTRDVHGRLRVYTPLHAQCHGLLYTTHTNTHPHVHIHSVNAGLTTIFKVTLSLSADPKSVFAARSS